MSDVMLDCCHLLLLLPLLSPGPLASLWHLPPAAGTGPGPTDTALGGECHGIDGEGVFVGRE